MTAGRKDKKIYKDLASGLLEEGKTVRIEASGYSMYPAIKPGNQIYIKAVKDRDDICPGDIIAWQREDDMVVHRLIHRYRDEEEYCFLTRGDSGRLSDRPVLFEDIVGVVVEIEGRSGKRKPVRKALIREGRYRMNSRRVWLLVRWKAVLRRVGS